MCPYSELFWSAFPRIRIGPSFPFNQFNPLQCPEAATRSALLKNLFLKKFRKIHIAAPVSEFLFLMNYQASACSFIKKETLVRVFSCEFCEVFKNILFTENHYMKIVQMLSFFWFVFSCTSTEYRNLRSKYPYSVQIRENADQKKLRMDNFFPGDCFWISSNIFCSILENFAINRKIALRQKC